VKGRVTRERKRPGLHTGAPARHTVAAYLQPGSNTVWPGGWHLAPPSFGPFWLLPGPKSGAATTGAAGMASAPVAKTAARSLRLRMVPPFVEARVVKPAFAEGSLTPGTTSLRPEDDLCQSPLSRTQPL